MCVTIYIYIIRTRIVRTLVIWSIVEICKSIELDTVRCIRLKSSINSRKIELWILTVYIHIFTIWCWTRIYILLIIFIFIFFSLYYLFSIYFYCGFNLLILFFTPRSLLCKHKSYANQFLPPIRRWKKK